MPEKGRNLIQGNIFGIQVSGMELSCSALSSTTTGGMDFVNGGSFGLKEDLAVTVVLVVSTLLALRVRPPKAKRSEEKP